MALTRIMIVEDEGIVASNIQKVLEIKEYQVTAVVSSGEEAVEKAAGAHPDLVLMDIHLAGKMDGVEAAEQLRDRFSIPVIYLTGHAGDETLQRAKATEPLGYIMKPFGPDDLLTAIEVGIHKHGIERERLQLTSQIKDERDQLIHDLGKRLKELECMYEVSQSIRENRKLNEIFLDVVKLIPPGWRYPEITRGKVRFDEEEYLLEPFAETPWKQSSNIIVHGEYRGSVEVYYLEEMPDLDEGPFLKEERNLIDGIARTLSEAIERKQAEEALQKAHDELEHLVEERTTALRRTNEQLRQEITEHQRTEAALREREERLDEAHRIAHLGHWDWSIQTNELYWSNEIYRIFGLKPQEFDATYEAFLKRVHPDDRAFVEQSVKGALQKIPHNIEHRIILPDGEVRTVHERGEVSFDEQGQPLRMLGTVQDITEHKRMEEEKELLEAQLRQAQKMDAVGQLTAGIAHNFNNALMGILNSLEEAQLEATDSSSLLQDAETMTLQAAEIVEQLMLFSRSESPIEFQPVGIYEAIRQTLEMCQRIMDRKILISYELSPNLPTIAGDPNQLEQVFLNLFINARDALKEGLSPSPHIQVGADVVHRREQELIAYPQAQGGTYLRIQVTDNGIGMDEKTRQRIFEPFFTTKDVGEGTGLGLATVFAVLQDHKGWIECESQPGVGTTFSIYLPVAEEQLAAAKETQREEVIPRGTETILVIEDEERVRLRLVSILERYGYSALMGADGVEGLEIFRQECGRIDLVMLDLSLPRLSGQEVLPQLRELNPEIPVIISTGFASHSAESLQVQALLKKPYRLVQALQTIRKVLDE